MKAKLSYPVALLLIALANAIAGVVCISLLPESVAVHFNLSFEVDRLGSPWIYLTFFLFPPLVAAGLLFESLRRGQKEKNRKPAAAPGSIWLLCWLRGSAPAGYPSEERLRPLTGEMHPAMDDPAGILIEDPPRKPPGHPDAPDLIPVRGQTAPAERDRRQGE